MLLPLSEQFVFQDLREIPELTGLDEFIQLYNETFTDEREREDPEQWRERLAQDVSPPQPVSHLLLAKSKETSEIIGGLVFEYYQNSQCGLLTYLVVHSEYRKLGIGLELVSRAVDILVEGAKAQGHSIRAVFAESENPSKVPENYGAMSPRARLLALSRMGFRWLNVPYVQPQLDGGEGRGDHLLLLSYPLSATSCKSLPGNVILSFLNEFYEALGVKHLQKDPDFLNVRRSLQHPIPLRDIPDFEEEKPILELRRCSVCLHLLEAESSSNEASQDGGYEYCPDFGSMELDLLSLAFQESTVCQSVSFGVSHEPVEIVFPDSLTYHTEGRAINLVTLETIQRATVSVSATRFPKSERTIWHIAITPRKGEYFSEFDVIKLIHLYDGRSEQTALKNRILFRKNDREEAQPAEKFFADLTGSGALSVRGGTIQICNEDGVYRGFQYSEMLTLAHSAREDETGKLQKELIELLKSDNDKKAVLLAYCGIVTGIFDFTEIDIEEALDTLEPTFADYSSFVRIHRATLVSISEDDRSLEACWDRLGASPYIVLPHAVLIHNEVMVEEAEWLLEVSLSHRQTRNKGFNRLRDKEINFHLADKKLGQYLPNIFNYVTERELYSKGVEGRGLMDRLKSTQNKLEELRHRNESIWNFRRENGQRFIGMLLALVSMFEIKGGLFGDAHWVPFIITTVVLEGFIYWLWGLGLKKTSAP